MQYTHHNTMIYGCMGECIGCRLCVSIMGLMVCHGLTMYNIRWSVILTYLNTPMESLVMSCPLRNHVPSQSVTASVVKMGDLELLHTV